MGEVQRPSCVASSQVDEHGNGQDKAGFFSRGELCADGVTLLTQNQSFTARTYFIDHQKLDPNTPSHLTRYAEYTFATPIHASAAWPFFSCLDPTRAVHLLSPVDKPIRLTNALDGSTVATYPLIHPTTEVFISPTAILWHPDGVHFFSGSRNRLCRFDALRYGSGPIETCLTTSGRRRVREGFRGTCAALAISKDHHLATGTLQRDVALYDTRQDMGLVTNWNLAQDDKVRDVAKSGKGLGVAQLEWSADSRYLYVAERKSDGVVIYDTRMHNRRLCTLVSRNACTMQRMQIDVSVSMDGVQEVYAGGTDGSVRIWRDPHAAVDQKEPDEIWEAHHDTVAVVIRSSTSNVIVTGSGSRRLCEQQDEGSTNKHSNSGDSSDGESGEASLLLNHEPEDFSLKVWTH